MHTRSTQLSPLHEPVVLHGIPQGLPLDIAEPPPARLHDRIGGTYVPRLADREMDTTREAEKTGRSMKRSQQKKRPSDSNQHYWEQREPLTYQLLTRSKLQKR